MTKARERKTAITIIEPVLDYAELMVRNHGETFRGGAQATAVGLSVPRLPPIPTPGIPHNLSLQLCLPRSSFWPFLWPNPSPPFAALLPSLSTPQPLPATEAAPYFKTRRVRSTRWPRDVPSSHDPNAPRGSGQPGLGLATLGSARISWCLSRISGFPAVLGSQHARKRTLCHWTKEGAKRSAEGTGELA